MVVAGAFLQFAAGAGGLRCHDSSNDELSWWFAEAQACGRNECMVSLRNDLFQHNEALHGFAAAWVQGSAGDRRN
eukprot:s7253_g1.t1